MSTHVTLEGHALVDGEDQDDVAKILESLLEDLGILLLRRPDVLDRGPTLDGRNGTGGVSHPRLRSPSPRFRY